MKLILKKFQQHHKSLIIVQLAHFEKIIILINLHDLLQTPVFIYNIHRYSVATIVFLCLIDLCKDMLTLRFTDRNKEFYQRTLTPGVHFMLPET